MHPKLNQAVEHLLVTLGLLLPLPRAEGGRAEFTVDNGSIMKDL